MKERERETEREKEREKERDRERERVRERETRQRERESAVATAHLSDTLTQNHVSNCFVFISLPDIMLKIHFEICIVNEL